ncbi:MAG: ABC transporter [Clostridiales bacterium Nov_37_41]|nr:ABC transporter ATP-binding protein [Oscillospiraceae bacterium]OKZ91169.1 MAG: ABC transporter [Clostridiales bacterium Nov_37_41]
MARIGQGTQKPKNMKQALGKLAIYCKKEFAVIIIALVLAVVGTVLTIIGPNQISKITDYMYDGLTGGISTEEIAEDIQKQITTGQLNILEFLPEGVDPGTVDLESLDLTNEDDPLAAAILENVRLSNEFAEAHKDGGIDMDGILSVCILLLTIYLISAICNFLQHFIMATITQKVSRRMRTDISKKINHLPLKYFSSNSYGDVLSRVTNDVDTIGQGLSNSAASIVSASAQFVGCLIMMFWNDWIMAITTIITTFFGIIFMAFIMKHSQRYFKQRQKSLGKLNGYIEEMYSGHDVIRISNAEKNVKSRFNELNLAVKDANFKSQFLSGLMQPIMNFVGNLGYVAVCIVGAILVINGNITFGVITAFLIYVRLFEQPLKQIAQGMTNMQSTAAATERVFEFLEEEELKNEDNIVRTKEDVDGVVDFENVHFAYPDTPDKEVIHGFSAHIKSGQKVAIVGPTGAGKTTLVNLLMRFFETTGGDIKIDGVSIKELRRENVHSMFGMVLQETWLFEGTVRENLVYNCVNVSDETMIDACKACGIHNFIKALPQGYDTVLNDNTSISAGQKQLFTIARAMIQNSPMLILDEATSSVDTRTEVITQKAMDQLTENRTSFVIAHRLSTIKNADVILVVKDGDIIEQGNHEELLAQNGFYADLYNSQFEKTA